MRRFLSRPRNRWFLVLALLLVVAPIPVRAAWQDVLPELFANLLFMLLQAVTFLVSRLINVLVLLCSVNDFYRHPIVLTGWNLVIQIANMMFIVALLVIAAGTVLNLQNYRYSKLLGNVLLMAVLVNFSRLIAGFFIQLSQIVMLTFVNSFQDALYGNFANMFGLSKVFEFAARNNLNEFKDMTQIVVALVVSLFFMVMAGSVIAAFVVIVVFRIVTLWALLITSPLAYALAILPQTKKFADQWWSQFIDQLTRGPVIAFYLWLALAIVSSYSTAHPTTGWLPGSTERIQQLQEADKIQFANEFLGFENIVGFIVAMTFLTLGLQQATAASGAAGKWAGSISKTTGGVLGFVAGANAVRDFAIRPIQGAWKMRQNRNEELVRNRTIGLDAGLARAGAMTTGQAARLRAGVTAAAGGVGRAGLSTVGDFVHNVNDALLKGGQNQRAIDANLGRGLNGALEAGTSAWRLGPESYQQQWKRVRDADNAAAARRGASEDLSKLSTEELIARAGTMNGASQVNYATELAGRTIPPNLQQQALLIHQRAGAQKDAEKQKDYRQKLIEYDRDMAAKAFFGGVMDDAGVLTESFKKALLGDKSLTRLLTPNQLKTLKNDSGSFVNTLHSICRTEKDFKTALENIDEDFRGDVTKNIDMSGQSLERRKMVGALTGHWDKVFDDKDKNVANNLSSELIQFVKTNKKKIKDTISTSAASNGAFLETLANNEALSEKDLLDIAERSDFHRKAVSEGLTGPNGLYQRAVSAAGGVKKTGEPGFMQQEVARRAAAKISRGKFLKYNAIDADADAKKQFKQLAKSAKAADIKSIHENEIFNDDKYLLTKEETLKAFGMHMSPREIGELSTMGEKQYETAKLIVGSILTPDNIQKYAGLSKKDITNPQTGLTKDEQALARRVQLLLSNESTADLSM
jgi:hypothetical protein